MNKHSTITLSHGSGGRLSHELIRELFVKQWDNPVLSRLEDSAVIEAGDVRIAFTTDSYVVKPLFFPGGDIGTLAVCGTVNDLAVVGADPAYISCGFMIEEDLEYSVLEKIVDSMKISAQRAGVTLVTGDTKVVERGSIDKLFIAAAGVGCIMSGVNLCVQNVRCGDKVILSGTPGEHAIAVLSCREELSFKTEIQSDCAPLNIMIKDLLLRVPSAIRFMRDPTRGGLATVLNEIVEGMKFGILMEESRVPLKKELQGICELLGFDPFYLASEGRVVIITAPEKAEQLCTILKEHEYGRDAAVIGEVVREHPGKVIVRTEVGGSRILDMLTGEQLPRIC